ncbi:hypothetical protein MTO96_028347 [Rhipicephalus appendiculatus]
MAAAGDTPPSAPSSLFASARLLAGLDFGCNGGGSDGGASAFRRVLPHHRDAMAPPDLPPDVSVRYTLKSHEYRAVGHRALRLRPKDPDRSPSSHELASPLPKD